MSGNTNFPTGLDDDSSLFDVIDASSTIIAAHHNNIKEAIKKIEAKLGIYNSGAPTSIDFRLSDPTAGHNHNGVSGMGGPLDPSSINAIVTFEHLVPWYFQGSIPSGASLGAPMVFGRDLQVLDISVQVRRAPSGATLALDINFGPTSLWQASQGNRPIFPAGSKLYQHASPNLVTYPSGGLIAIDADKVGTSEPGMDLSVIFTFRD